MISTEKILTRHSEYRVEDKVRLAQNGMKCFQSQQWAGRPVQRRQFQWVRVDNCQTEHCATLYFSVGLWKRGCLLMGLLFFQSNMPLRARIVVSQDFYPKHLCLVKNSKTFCAVQNVIFPSRTREKKQLPFFDQ